jgi:hypothetical protein
MGFSIPSAARRVKLLEKNFKFNSVDDDSKRYA